MKILNARYRMDIYIGDNMLESTLYLSKKEFNRILTELKSQHEDHKESEANSEFFTEYREEIKKDNEKERVTMYVFGHGVSEIYLWKFEAKDGYGYAK